MCDYTNEPNSVHAFLMAKIAKLEEQLEEYILRDIGARNPGIDLGEVRIFRAAQRENMKES